MQYEFPLIARQHVAEETMEFTLDTSGSDFTFRPGQHADYTLINPPQTDAEGNTRTFSFANPPGEDKIQFATRMRKSAFKNSLVAIPLGTKIAVKGPMGRMTLHKDASKPAVFLVGGIGITPFISMLLEQERSPESRRMTLLYSNKNQGSAAFYGDLHRLEEALPHFNFVPSFSDQLPEGWRGERGRINEAMIRRHVDNPLESIFYTAGPPAMVSSIIALIESLGVPEEQIKSEDFAGY